MNTTTAKVKAPHGVSRKAREQFLALTPEQQETYRYHFNVCGRPAALCLRFTLEGVK